MKVIRTTKPTIKYVATSIALATLTACGGGGGGSSAPDNTKTDPVKQTPTKNDPAPSTVKKKTAVAVKVVNKDKIPLAEVAVVSGNNTLKTDKQGMVRVELANTATQTLVIKKAGYITTAQDVLPIADKTLQLTVALVKDQVTKSFDTKSGVQATLDSGARVSIPKNAIQKPDGSDYTGKVTLSSSYYSPETAEGSNTFARPYRGANADGSNEVGLMSVGVIEAKLTDEQGNPLQLKEGNVATLSVPANSVSGDQKTIPLWYYDEAKKIWVQEGNVTKQADGSYRGTVKHFTLWNVDIPIAGNFVATVQGCYVDKDKKPTPYYFGAMRTTGWENSGGTDAKGKFTVQVPSGRSLQLYSYFGNKHFDPVVIKPLAPGENRQLDCVTLKDAGKNALINLSELVLPEVTTVFNPQPVEQPNPQTPTQTANLPNSSGSINVGGTSFTPSNASDRPSFSMMLGSTFNYYNFYGAEKDGQRDEVSIWLNPTTAEPIYFIHKAAGSQENYSCTYLSVGKDQTCKGVTVTAAADRKSLTVTFDKTKVFNDEKEKVVSGSLTAGFPQAMKYLKAKDLSTQVKSSLTVDGKPKNLLFTKQNDVKEVNGKTTFDYNFAFYGNPAYELSVNTARGVENTLKEERRLLDSTKFRCILGVSTCKGLSSTVKDGTVTFNFDNMSYENIYDSAKKHTVNGTIVVPSTTASIKSELGNLTCDPFTCASQVMVNSAKNSNFYFINLNTENTKNNSGINSMSLQQDLYDSKNQLFTVALKDKSYFCNTSTNVTSTQNIACEGLTLSEDGLTVTLKNTKVYAILDNSSVTLNGTFSIRGS